jgi:hypothetical protein
MDCHGLQCIYESLVSLVEFGLDHTFHVLNIFNFQWSKRNEAKGAGHNLIFTRPVKFAVLL